MSQLTRPEARALCAVSAPSRLRAEVEALRHYGDLRSASGDKAGGSEAHSQARLYQSLAEDIEESAR